MSLLRKFIQRYLLHYTYFGRSLMYAAGRIDDAVQSWITILSAMDVDLVEYGRHEQHAIAQSSQYLTLIKYHVCLEQPIEHYYHSRIINLEYGPSASDWKVWISWPLDEWAGEFWNWVENPEFFMAGAWVEDEADIEINLVGNLDAEIFSNALLLLRND